jgi:hypothetical protein
MTTSKKNGQSQDPETNFSIYPHWTTTAWRTKEKMAGTKRPLGPILEWKMIIMIQNYT